MRLSKQFSSLFLVATYAVVPACICVAPPGYSTRIGDQSNIIVWNPKTSTEHFIRYAFFDSKAPDVGFIAPTPSLPELSVADREAYTLLETTKPEPISFSCSGAEANAPAAATAGGIEVLQTVEVGRYEAKSLKATDSAVLANYLKSNGYASSPGLKKWTEKYVQMGWILTAFKVKNQSENGLSMDAIRMSFKTDKPFNPYYVPSENVSAAGKLKLYFVADGGYSGAIGKEKGEAWVPAAWTSNETQPLKGKLGPLLKLSDTDIPENPTVSYFESTFPVADKDDLYFTRNASVSPFAFGVPVAIFAALIAMQRKRRHSMPDPSI